MKLRLRGDSPSDPAKGGFTLVELMIVLVLIAIMTAMILPEMKGTFEDALLRSTSRKLMNAFNLAYSRAVSVNQLHRVRIDAAKGRYVIEKRVQEREGGMAFVPASELPEAEGELDTRIKLEVRNAAQMPMEEPRESEEPKPPQEAAPAGRPDIISFYPDGTADAREIVLKDREGFQLALRINPVTARVRAVELERE